MALETSPKTYSIQLATIIYFACIIGCVYHIVSISLIFFQYSTVTRVTERVVDSLPTPTINLCINYTEYMKLETGKWNRLRMTIKQMFQSTPDFSDVLMNCNLRYFKSHRIYNANRTECLQHFITKKFFMYNTICYQIEPLDSRHLDFKVISNTVDHPGVVYTMEIDPKKIKFDSFFPIAFFGSYAWDSRKMTTWTKRGLNEHGIAEYNEVIVRLKNYDITLLPRPYDTMCIDTSKDLPLSFYERCMIKLLLKCNRFSFSAILDSPLDMYPFSLEDFDDEYFNATFYAAYNKCERAAKWICKDTLSLTRFEKHKGHPYAFVISNSIPIEPTVIAVTLPKIATEEYIIYVLSLLGIWFGFRISFLIPRVKKRNFCNNKVSTFPSNNLQQYSWSL